MEDRPDKKDEDTGKSWGAKFPAEYAAKVEKIARENGYQTISELIRDGVRRLIWEIEGMKGRSIIEHLLITGKITSNDLTEAVINVAGIDSK